VESSATCASLAAQDSPVPANPLWSRHETPEESGARRRRWMVPYMAEGSRITGKPTGLSAVSHCHLTPA